MIVKPAHATTVLAAILLILRIPNRDGTISEFEKTLCNVLLYNGLACNELPERFR